MGKTKTHTTWGLASLLIGLVLTSGCRWIDPDEPTPAFVHVPAITLTSSGETGSNSHKITEVWLFADGETIGAYQLPANIPVLREGPINCSFYAGIKNNGAASTRILYPFYTPHDVTLELVPGETVTVEPEFAYRSNTVVASEEDFESAGLDYTWGDLSQIQEIPTEDTDESFEGKSAHIVIPSDFTFWQGVSADTMTLPSGKQVFVEMDYKCNNNFAVGVYAWPGSTFQKHLVAIVNPTNSDGPAVWNKIYIELTDVIAANPGNVDFQLYIDCNRQSDVDQAELYFDNIKILHFPG